MQVNSRPATGRKKIAQKVVLPTLRSAWAFIFRANSCPRLLKQLPDRHVCEAAALSALLQSLLLHNRRFDIRPKGRWMILNGVQFASGLSNDVKSGQKSAT
jgi:hypothetical protein